MNLRESPDLMGKTKLSLSLRRMLASIACSSRSSYKRVTENIPDPVAEMIELLKSDVLQDRLAAIRALGEVGDQRALKSLQNYAISNPMEPLAIVNAVQKISSRIDIQ
jgi:HEAT repeat protein